MAHASPPRESWAVLALLLVFGTIAGCSPTSKTPDYTQQIIDMAAADKGLPGAWSKPSNGLIGRIEGYQQDLPEAAAIFIRLKNIGSRDLSIPLPNSKHTPGYRVGFLSSSGWNTVSAYARWGGGTCPGRITPDKPYLEPGQDMLIFLTPMPDDGSCVVFDYRIGEWEKPVYQNSVITLLMESKAPPSDQFAWHGRLEMPAVLMYGSPAAKATLPLPTAVPPLSHSRLHGGNFWGNETEFYKLYAANGHLIEQLQSYRDGEVCEAMQSRIWEERDDIHLALVYAELVAERGGEQGRIFLREALKSNDIPTVRSALYALIYVASPSLPGTAASHWARDEFEAAMKDHRPVLDPFEHLRKWTYVASDDEQITFESEFFEHLRKWAEIRTHWDKPKPPLTVAELAGEFSPYFQPPMELPATSQAASSPAVDVPKMKELLKRAKNDDDVGHAIYELSQAGTPQALDAMIEALGIDFSKFPKGKVTSYEPYNDQIARLLREATGQPFGADPAVWRAWWTQKGCKMQKFK